MNTAVKQLNELLQTVPQRIKSMPEGNLTEKPLPGKWSKKEILGHLCDSAINNIPRAVKAQFEPQPFKVVDYAQDDWVKLGDYQSQRMDNVLQLWTSLNKQFINIISLIPEEKLSYECEHYSGGRKTLGWLIEDYVVHMKHHLDQIFS